jgi:spore germination protein GerM
MMPRRTTLAYVALAVGLIAALLLLIIVGPRWLATQPAGEAGTAPAAAPSGAATRKIHARLFYVAEDGRHLAPVEQEVPFAEGSADQARQIVEAQLGPAPAPYGSAIPPGTKLRAIYLTERGEAHVDLSREVTAAHPGGTTNEILTVYAIVNALAVNLPAVSSVQILVDGQEVDTLAGHIDLRRPLQQDLGWVSEPGPAKGTS